MQVATNQRPHPPPVPPRPSRQMVAEALKRSPRPPCPTRQAPPPPNTKPWRSEDHESVPQGRGGRTVVYESLKESLNGTEVSRCLNEARVVDEAVRSEKASSPKRSSSSSSEEDGTVDRSSNEQRSSKTVACKIDKAYGVANKKITNDVAASERHQQEAENHRERRSGGEEKKFQPQPRSNGGGQHCDWENCSVKSSENSDDRTRDIKKESSLIPCDTMLQKVELHYDVGDDHSQNWPIGKNYSESLASRLSELSKENIPENSLAKKSGFPVANGTKNVDNVPPKTIDTCPKKIPTSPTTNLNNEKCLDAENTRDPDSRFVKQDSLLSTRNNSTTTISSDDCTTVVVIDEPQRRISFNEDNDNIHHQDWLEAGVRYSSTKITLPGDENTDRNDSSSQPDDDDDDPDHRDYQDDQLIISDSDFARIRERIAMSSLQGLPPLPRSLSGFNLNEGRREACEPPPPPTRSSSKTPKNVKSTQPSGSRPSPPGRQLTTLDTQLAILRKEMFGLRQLDLSLLSQLWSLNESIQEFRQLLQEQEDRAPSPSPSSEEGDDTSYGSHPPPPPRRPAPLLHHHRPPRPPRPLRPPASDESPSSEEYGAV